MQSHVCATFSLNASKDIVNKKEKRRPIICRTENTLITDLAESDASCCQNKFQRRLKYRGTGYFSAQSQPYKTFGSVTSVNDTDVSETIQWRNLTDSTHSTNIQWRPARQQSSKGHFKYNQSRYPTPQQLTISVQKRAEGRSRLPPSINAGFSSINVGLCASEWGRREICAGDCFINTVNRQRERKSFLHECQQAKLHQQKRQFNKTHTPSVYLNGLSVQNSYKGSLVSKNLEAVLINNDVVFRSASSGLQDESESGYVEGKRRKAVFPNYLIVALAASYFKNGAMRHCKGKKLRAELAEKQNKYIDKLNTIYSILCALYNMRPKDLKSKTPLSVDVMSVLCQKPRFYSGSDPTDSKQRNIQRVNKSSSTAARMASIDLTGQYYIVSPNGPLREIPPPWQRQITIIDGERDISSIEKLQVCGRKFQHVQEEMSDKLLKKIKEYDKCCERRMAIKLECLGFSSDAYGELKMMREKARSWKYSNKKGLTLEKPEWILMLEQDASINLKQPHFIRKGASVINRMQFFTLLDIAGISHVVEKLCLYTFSVPAYSICSKPTTDAIKFVLEYALQIKPDLFNQWMDIRKLPLPPTD